MRYRSSRFEQHTCLWTTCGLLKSVHGRDPASRGPRRPAPPSVIVGRLFDPALTCSRPAMPTRAQLRNRDYSGVLLRAGIRPTRQRLAIASLLFVGDRHVTAEELHAELGETGMRVSLATVYNTLHQFRLAGLVRELAVDGTRTYFDTNLSNHNHYYVPELTRVFDIPGSPLRVEGVPTPPEGYEVEHVDVLVRLVKTKAKTRADDGIG